MTLTPKKSLGQNFLQDPNTIRKIVASVTAPPEAPVVEIGPGMGAMTAYLAEQYDTFVALEIDERAVAHLRDELPEIDVRHQDVLAVDWSALAAELGGRLHVVGNLPYYITSPILFGLIDARAHVADALLMMQLEVAERLVAEPRTKAYGILSVVTQTYASPELLFRISPNVFYPRPDVTSALVRLTFDKVDEVVDHDLLRTLVRTAFNQRRKTLRNSLGTWARDPAIGLPDGWNGRRAEELTPAEFADLARHVVAAQAAAS